MKTVYFVNLGQEWERYTYWQPKVFINIDTAIEACVDVMVSQGADRKDLEIHDWRANPCSGEGGPIAAQITGKAMGQSRMEQEKERGYLFHIKPVELIED